MKQEPDVKEGEKPKFTFEIQSYSNNVNRYGIPIKRKKKVVKSYKPQEREGVATIDPKVNEPFEQIPRRISRAAMIDKVRESFSKVDLVELFKQRNLDFGSEEVNSSYFELEDFDDKSYDIYPNSHWIEKAGVDIYGKRKKIPGKLLGISEGNVEFTKILVTSYDPLTEIFNGIYDDGSKTEFSAKKIKICFDAENPFIFTKRIEEAVKLRKKTEEMIKYKFYISNMPVDEIERLESHKMRSIVELICSLEGHNIVGSALKAEKKLMNESYVNTVHKITFDNLYFKQKSSELTCGDLKVELEQAPPVPKKGKEQIQAFNMEKMNKALSLSFLYTKPNIIKATLEIKMLCNTAITDYSLFEFNLAKTQTLEEYKKTQRVFYSKFKTMFDGEGFIGRIKHLLNSISLKETVSGKFEIDFLIKNNRKKVSTFKADERREENIELLSSRMNLEKTANYISMVNNLVEDSIFRMLVKNLIDFVKFFERRIPVEVLIDNTNSIENIYKPELFPKIKNIAESHIKLGTPNAFGVETEHPNEDLDTTYDFISSVGLNNQLEDLTVFNISLNFDGEKFYFSKTIDNVIAELSKLFEEIIEKMNKYEKITTEKEKNPLMIKHFHPLPKIKIIEAEREEGENPADTQKETKDWLLALLARFKQSLELCRKPTETFLQKFNEYASSMKIVPEEYIKEFEDMKSDPDIQVKLKDDIEKHFKLIQRVKDEILDEAKVSLFNINCTYIKKSLTKIYDNIIGNEINLLQVKAAEMKQGVQGDIEQIKKEINKTASDIDELVEIEKYMEDVPNRLDSIKVDIEACMEIYGILDEFNISVSFTEYKARWTLFGFPTEVINLMNTVKNQMNKIKNKFEDELEENKKILSENITDLTKKLGKVKDYHSIDSLQTAAALANQMMENFEDYKQKTRLYNIQESHFGLDNQTDYTFLQDMDKDFDPFYKIWTSIDNFTNKTTHYNECPFSELNGEEVKDMNDMVNKNLNNSIKKLKEKEDSKFDKLIELAIEMKKQSEEFKPIARLAVVLTTKGMQDRHWVELKETAGIDCINQEGLTLEKIAENCNLTNDVLNKAQLIADKADREYKIDLKLKELEERWKTVDFDLMPYRNMKSYYTISGWGDIYTVLDEDVLEVQQLEISPFKGPFLDVINEWSNGLLTISNVLENWKKFQVGWMKLQPIFDSSDIKKQIPDVANKFKTANTKWRLLGERVSQNRNVKEICTDEKVEEDIESSLKLLEDVERGLNEYIDKKKAFFPRFFFISDDDLIEILSQTKDLSKIKDSLKKIFENIHYIELKEERSIVKILSSLKEEMVLKTPVIISGQPVEKWMGDLEASMFESVKSYLEKAIRRFKTTERKEFVLTNSGQSVIHTNQVIWTEDVELNVEKASITISMESTKDRIKTLVEIMRAADGLSRPIMITLSNLITMEVHNKDVTQGLIDINCTDVLSFEWIKQMRYYWEKNEMIVKSIQTNFPYGYEYLGNTEILVITPLTDKCYLTLMGALKMNMGGAPAGPAGTGKTETTKDLAKAIAKQCIVYNCSEETDFNIVAKFFKGLACCGAWICFDEFNRINIEVLSVIAQQLIFLFGEKAKMKPNDPPLEINFERTIIKMKPTFCVFITMNPTYAGRTELPDNLKALFRPISMMVPNYKLIANVYLYAAGYLEADDLSRKIVATFKLSSEQLSDQSHYDFGMRAVKSVLYASKKLKRNYPDVPENQLLLRALEDVNVPKFLEQDIPSFNYIIKDLFPKVERPESDLADLEAKIHQNCHKRKLIPTPGFVKKVIQLYDTIQVRHGLMIVGPTGGGKTMNSEILKESLTDLNDGKKFHRIQKYCLNPKSVRKDQLFCEKDENTMEWINGILPIIVQDIAHNNAPSTKYWIMFDGPVDTLWIEDMNSVLDDSRKLCLASSAIIVLNENIVMMFEVEDLVHASPATVSRCGMVFMEPASLGLQAICDSWLEKLPSNLYNSPFKFKEKLNEIFQVFVQPCANLLRSKLKEPCPSTDVNICSSFLKILGVFTKKYDDKENPKVTDIDVELFITNMPKAVFYCLVWSFGVTTDEAGRIKFDAFLRETIEANFDESLWIPKEGSVYDFYYDVEKDEWTSWKSMLDKQRFAIKPRMPYTEIIIPTVDSFRYNYVIKSLVLNKIQVITTGPTGTGKTVNMLNILSSGLNEKFMFETLNFSAQTSASQTQEFIDSKVRKVSRKTYKPPQNKVMAVFIDDLNMPKKEKYEAQPPIELIRQWLDYGGWYDVKSKEKSFMNLEDLLFVGAMGPPSGGRSVLTNRLMRHFALIAYTELEDNSIRTIFTKKVMYFLGKFPDEVKEQTDQLVNCTLTLYKEIKDTLLPTPKNCHYLFNLRDMSKVLQGVCNASFKYLSSKQEIVRLWVHEMNRAFGDRLINDENRNWLKSIIDGQLKDVLKEELTEIYNADRLIYNDFMTGADKQYIQATDLKKFIKKIEDKLEEYNEEPKVKPMRLVMFLDACDHVSRISRILSQNQGNALLLGVGGSGRQSLARLATYINKYELYQIEVFKGYKMIDFRKNLKECLIEAGAKEQPYSFLIVDTQLFDEQVLEDLNNILNIGDVPDLYTAEDKDIIRQACRGDCVSKGLPETWNNIFAIYLNRVKANLHCVIAMSPVGEAFPVRLRMFPSLVNCCTIDWFTEWPEEALLGVAKDNIAQNELDLGKDTEGCIQSIKFIHKYVEKESLNFLNELRRYNYLTPTSFLEFLGLYHTILEKKKEETERNINRLKTGLQVLEFAGKEIKVIEEEINRNQPMLVEATKETTEVLKELDAKKKVSDVVSAEAEVEKKKAEEFNRYCTELDREAKIKLDEAQLKLDSALEQVRNIKEDQLRNFSGLRTASEKMNIFLEILLIFDAGNSFRKKGAYKTKDGKETASLLEAAKTYYDFSNPTNFKGYFLKFLEEENQERLKYKDLHKINACAEFIEKNKIDEELISKAAGFAVSCFTFINVMIEVTNDGIQNVDPLKKKANEVREQKTEAEEALRIADEKDSAAKAESRKLEENYNEKMMKKNNLAFTISENQTMVERAKKLVNLLSSEKERWSKSVAELEEYAKNLNGNCLYAAAMIAYAGPFTSEYRKKLEVAWIEELKRNDIKVSPGLSLRSVLEDALLTRQWNMSGLPNDNLSIENGIIMFNTRKWPLMIDPQNQAAIFLKRFGQKVKDTAFSYVKATDAKMVENVISGVKFGYWVVLDNVGLSLETALEPILMQQKIKRGNYTEIKIGEKTIPYNEDFKLFMITSINNPHYSPETFAKITITNFAITPSGLEDQMLSVLINVELPEIEENKNKILEDVGL